MEVAQTPTNGGLPPPFHDHDVHEWSTLDSLTGVLERARIETDHWTANTNNSSHKYGKVSRGKKNFRTMQQWFCAFLSWDTFIRNSINFLDSKVTWRNNLHEFSIYDKQKYYSSDSTASIWLKKWQLITVCYTD